MGGGCSFFASLRRRPDFTEYHRTVRGVAKASPGTSARLDPKYRCERWRLPEVARDCPRLPEVARGCPRLPEVPLARFILDL